MLLLTHLVFFGLTSFILNIEVSVLGFIFSALPDIDNPNSIIGQMFPKLSNYLLERFGHRGLTHSIFPLILLGVVALGNANLLEILIGYASHLLLDSFNSFGIMVLYPNNTRFVLFNLGIRVGSNIELLLNFALIGIASAYAYFVG
jgi:inner membrane protein